jgi:hypothetical protein
MIKKDDQPRSDPDPFVPTPVLEPEPIVEQQMLSAPTPMALEPVKETSYLWIIIIGAILCLLLCCLLALCFCCRRKKEPKVHKVTAAAIMSGAVDIEDPPIIADYV